MRTCRRTRDAAGRPGGPARSVVAAHQAQCASAHGVAKCGRLDLGRPALQAARDEKTLPQGQGDSGKQGARFRRIRRTGMGQVGQGSGAGHHRLPFRSMDSRDMRSNCSSDLRSITRRMTCVSFCFKWSHLLTQPEFANSQAISGLFSLLAPERAGRSRKQRAAGRGASHVTAAGIGHS